jgi:hypothetical protein
MHMGFRPLSLLLRATLSTEQLQGVVLRVIIFSPIIFKYLRLLNIFSLLTLLFSFKILSSAKLQKNVLRITNFTRELYSVPKLFRPEDGVSNLNLISSRYFVNS